MNWESEVSSPVVAALSGLCLNRHRILESTDVDETREMTSTVFGSHRLAPMGSCGALHATLDHLPLGAISLNRLRWGALVHVNPNRLPGYYLVSLPTRGAARVTQDHLGQSLSPGCAGVFSPSPTFFLEAHRDFDQLLISVSVDCIERAWAAITGEPLSAPIVFDMALPASGTEWQTWLALVRLASDSARLPVSGKARRFSEVALANAVASTLLTRHKHNQSRLLDHDRTEGGPAHVRRAESFLEERLREPVVVADVARACGISRRSLFAAFQANRGLSPMQWLRERRLEAARVELRAPAHAGTTVAQVAIEFGFCHLGEFAAAYRKRFDELPSATLRRGRQA